MGSALKLQHSSEHRALGPITAAIATSNSKKGSAIRLERSFVAEFKSAVERATDYI